MSALALVLYVAYLALAFGFRSWMQRRATGDAGFRGISGRSGSLEWWGGVSFVLALAAGLTAPVATILGMPQLELPLVAAWSGVALMAAGTVLAVASQMAMGVSWRIGVDVDESTEMVSSGPFALVRNPFFTATALAGGGLALMVPNIVSLAGLAVLVLAIQVQVRAVEEPYLLSTHGDGYRRYASRVGRFVPLLGRQEPQENVKTEVSTVEGDRA